VIREAVRSAVKLNFFAEFHSVLFGASELALTWNSECLRMSTFFRGITETVSILFCGIFSERNSVPNTMCTVYTDRPIVDSESTIVG
jgi:hypothetical protein